MEKARADEQHGGRFERKIEEGQPTASLTRGFSQPEGGQNPRESPYDIPMGKASRTKHDGDRRARIAAQREAQRRAEQRKRIYLAGGSVLAVAIVVIALVLVKLNSGSGTAAPASNGPTGAALAAVTKQVTTVPASVTDTVAGGGVPSKLFVSTKTSAEASSAASNPGSYFGTANGTPLTSGGKPEVLYVGAEYCPYCAAQRWAMVNALSRFGTFTGLTTSHSSSTDAYPNTPTFTFYKSTYKSDYVTFTPVEETTNTIDPKTNNYAILQVPTTAQQQIMQTYDPGTNGQGGAIPFIDIGNKYVQVGNLSPLTPTLLAGKTWAQIGAAMNDPSSAIGKAIIGNANYMTAAICKLTNNQPAAVCTPTIQKLESDFAS
jgi:thiol-disulfide isomerase/thioredoxin